MSRIVTELGGTVELIQADEAVGPGVLMLLGVDHVFDPRKAEIYLSPKDIARLKQELAKWPNPGTPHTLFDCWCGGSSV